VRLLPCDLDAEAAVVSGCVYHGAFDLIADATRPEHFMSDAFAKLIEGCFEVSRGGAKPDSVTVGSWLKSTGVPDRCDDLEKLAGRCPDPSQIEAYAKIVREKSMQRRAIKWAEQTAAQGYENVADVGEWLSGCERGLFDLTQDKRADTGADMSSVLRDAFSVLLEIENGTRPAMGLETGLIGFDTYTTGMRPGELFVVAARPGMGKTALATQIADYVSSGENPVGAMLFSLEMPREQLALRLVASEAHVDLRKLRCGQLDRVKLDHSGQTDHQRVVEAARRLARSNLWIDDQQGITPIELLSRVRRRAAEWSRRNIKLGLVVVDYIQLMSGGKKCDNRQDEVSYISRSLKSLAREMKIPVIALAQLNRNVEKQQDKRPNLADLRESGAIEQDADCVCMLYRDEYYTKGKNPKTVGYCELIVAKQRNGPTGIIVLGFDAQCTYFKNVDADARKRYKIAVKLMDSGD
jgi:replicative DNA helicase